MSKCFVVLGMHRSATSLIAGGIRQMGVHIGDELLEANESNPHGHFENIEFIQLNDAILDAAGGTWDAPPSHEAIIQVGTAFAHRIAALIAKHERPLWGWKDPRTTLTIDLYVRHLKSPHFVCCFRDPQEVAASLHRRDGMPEQDGIALAEEYNSRLLAFLERYHRDR